MQNVTLDIRRCASWQEAGRDHAFNWAVAVSFALHVIVGGASFYRAVNAKKPPRIQDNVAVRILSEGEFQMLNPGPGIHREMAARADSSVKRPGQIPTTHPSAVQAPAEKTIRATRFFAAEVLADAGNKQIRQKLPLLARRERILQLCNIEAVEQLRDLRESLHPEHIVADARSDSSVKDLKVLVNGGAVWTNGSWLNLKYTCEVSGGIDKVVNFEFAIGRPIPRKYWKKYFLPEMGTDAD